MANEVFLTVGELRSILSESAGKFKPKYGEGVKGEKEQNRKAVKDMMSDVEKYNPKRDDKKGGFDYGCLTNGNKSTMEANFFIKPDKNYMKRNRALAKGYSSEMAEDNGIEKDPSLEYDGNERIYKAISDSAKERSERNAKERHSGLKTKEKSSEKENRDNTMFNEGKMKRLSFKRTVFLSESDMLSHVPETYKKIGSRFSVKDASGNEYIVECKGDEKYGYVKPEVVTKFNNAEIKKQFERMKGLYGYRPSKYNASARRSEGSEVSENLDRVRKIK